MKTQGVDHRVGVWLIGACGAVATTMTVGVAAARRNLCALRGVTTEGPRGDGLDLSALDRLVFGGWETSAKPLHEAARDLAERERIFDSRLLEPLAEDLERVEAEIVRGGTRGTEGPLPGEGEAETLAVIERLRGDLAAFRRRTGVERVVVVNLATTERLFATPEDHLDLGAFERALAGRGTAVRASTLYAYAAMREHAAFVNFAASPAALVPALRELAEREGVPFAGTDGKTGETLVKSAHAGLFRERDLRVLAWHGENLLGNADGASLVDPEVRAAKVESKDAVVRGVLGYQPATSIGIGYVPSLGDWKTAWDLVHFEGFLGTRMTMQFTWQGSDSILAAPLVVDLVRLGELALRRGERGAMSHAACFFKSPVGTDEHDLGRQYAMLDQYLRRCRVAAVAGRKAAAS